MLFRDDDGRGDWLFRKEELKILLWVFAERLELNKDPFFEWFTDLPIRFWKAQIMSLFLVVHRIGKFCSIVSSSLGI